MGVDTLAKRSTAVGDLHLLAADTFGVTRPIVLRDERCARPSFHDTLLSVSQLCAERGASCRFGMRNEIDMPADESGHQPSFRLHRNGGVYELRAQVLLRRAANNIASPPRSLTVRAA
eukprot:6210712-Pleurochrysis_carterae.AAC.2